MSEEFDSEEMAGGEAIGINGEIHGFNADVEARLADALMDIGRWTAREAGELMGHIKLAITADGDTVTLNLTDLTEGVLYHGKVRPCRLADFSFMAAVLDVDKDKLKHAVFHALEDSGVNLTMEGHSQMHHHHHGENCGCHDHHHQ